MKKISLVYASLSFSLLTGCASVVNGTHQTIAIETTPTKDAHCALENNKGKWYVTNTPASVVVHRSYKDLVVTCEKPGYDKSTTTVKSKTQAAVLGNLILGGGLGAGIDTINGSAYEYPLQIKISLLASKEQKSIKTG